MNVQKYNANYFSRKAKRLVGSLIDYYAYKSENHISLYYFDKEKNVGDILNPYLIEKLFEVKCVQRQKGKSSNLLAIGSVMHEAKITSYIWGSGFISTTDLPKRLDSKKIRALRGKESVRILGEKYNINLGDIPLGDPGILMPLVYQTHKEKKYKIGIVPHYVDKDKIPESVSLDENIRIIDVQQDPEGFVNDLMECSNILSSSLHGLILSDAYDIPNKWIVLSDRLVGGEFKFHDYYSTTEKPDEKSFTITTDDELVRLIEDIDSYANVKRFNFSKEDLLNAFPKGEL
ncbi:polysaccharide pyruvyl transferase family protein [Zobellella taiwanensis]|uniref:polysaccharide pyruvyl transferase family protein n=1 Tax=Zobellella taiwanensis TaxID=347535 RepID=UPI0011B1D34D|nr:polysaccharide pyruvyl transferase family protein [Zobellella taiwanensis]